MTDCLIVTVEAADENRRVDVYLAEQLAGPSRSAIQKWIDEGRVTLRGRPIKANHKISEGEDILVDIPPTVALEVLPQPIPLDVLYEDDDLIVVNKPQGMVVHPAAGHREGTLVNALLYHCGGSLSGINGVLRPGIVHRIDKDTSGSLVVAKNDATHRFLAAQLEAHQMNRRYLAVVCGQLTEDALTIQKPIGRHPVDRKRMAAFPPGSPQGKEAVTHIQTLSSAGGYTLAEARLETGRTHQIRVHMASIGHPVLGDPVYGPKHTPGSLSPLLKGQALHAWKLSFQHPNGRQVNTVAPLPPCFVALCEKLGLDLGYLHKLKVTGREEMV